jgi:hypothetical protein
LQFSLQAAASPETFGYTLVRCEGVDWINLALNGTHWWAVVNSAVNLRVLTGRTTVVFSERALPHAVSGIITRQSSF